MTPRRNRRAADAPTPASEPARPAGAFAWPSRAKAEARAANARRRADEALSRLRARQQARAVVTEVAPAEPAASPSVNGGPPSEPASVGPSEPAPVVEPVGPQAGAVTVPQAEPVAHRHPWEQEFDALAERLIAGLRRDLGPARRP